MVAVAVQRQPPIEIPLGGGPDEATGRLFRGPGKLRVAQNVDQTKQGQLGKRRGYRLLDLSRETGGAVPGTIVEALGTYRGELVVIGPNEVYGAHTDETLATGHAVTYRGPSLVGNWRRTDLVAGGIGD